MRLNRGTVGFGRRKSAEQGRAWSVRTRRTARALRYGSRREKRVFFLSFIQFLWHIQWDNLIFSLLFFPLAFCTPYIRACDGSLFFHLPPPPPRAHNSSPNRKHDAATRTMYVRVRAVLSFSGPLVIKLEGHLCRAFYSCSVGHERRKTEIFQNVTTVKRSVRVQCTRIVIRRIKLSSERCTTDVQRSYARRDNLFARRVRRRRCVLTSDGKHPDLPEFKNPDFETLN